MAKYRLQLIRPSTRLGDVLTDESAEDEFSHIICLNAGFIPKRGIPPRLRNEHKIVQPVSYTFLVR